ncbi:hypothetical protein ZTR_06508 [Talaromyces verruculosus]|nr:hypothetical protein ZTR_06508 [Talaromyces verruculosus]
MKYLHPTPTESLRDPLRWPFWLRCTAVVVTSLANLVGNMAGAGISVAIPVLMQEFHKSQSDATQVLTFNFLFLGIGNIFWVPVAMKFGKRVSMLCSMAMLAGMLAWAAASQTFNSLVAARCLIGFAAAAGESIVPDIVADTSFTHQRGAMMAIYVVLISGGSAIGPLISGFMVSNTSDTWRSSVWLCFGMAILDLVLMFFFYPESNFDRPQESFDQSQALQEFHRSAKIENIQTEEFVEDSSSTPTAYTIRTPPMSEILRPVSYNSDLNFFLAMFEPLKLLAHPSVVWAIFTYGICLSPQVILIFTMSPLLEAPPYLFNTSDVGLMQIAAIVGFILAFCGGGMLSDFINGIIVRRTASRFTVFRAEHRLISIIPGMLIGPAGCILLAFACGHQMRWSAIAVGFGLVSFGTVYTPNIAITYVTQRHQRDAAKCLVLINVFKNLVAFVFLYVAVDWVNKNGYVQVYMIMFMLNILVLGCALPLYYFGMRNQVEFL